MFKDSRVLQIKNVSKSFGGIRALDNISFDLYKGRIHALCGENGAGKSTLMKILSGELKKDSGEIILNDTSIDWKSPNEALRGGIVIIAQELNPLLEMTLAENIFLGREPTKNGFLDKALLQSQAREALGYFGLDYNVNQKMKDLSIAQIQMIEIVKAISYDSEIIIMDEPTAAIGELETKKLFEVIKKLKTENKTIIYISHRMQEIYKIADDVTILRDGKHVITSSLADLSSEDLIGHMIGKKSKDTLFYSPRLQTDDEVLLRVENLSKKNLFSNINFTLHKKEILGIFGLMGSGRSSLIQALFGAIRPDQGTIELENKKISFKKPKRAISAKLAYVTEDRKDSGLIISHSLRDNISLPSLDDRSNFAGIINIRTEKQEVNGVIDKFNIKTRSYLQKVMDLSGGNQQKVVLAKWILTHPKILLLDEPTRGIDVGAKQEIYEFMNAFLEEGKGIILVSSELPEIIAMSHRILLFKRGTIIAEYQRTDFDQEKFMHLIS